MYVNTRDFQAQVRIVGRLAGDVKKEVNGKDKTYARFTVYVNMGKDNPRQPFTCFYNNMSEVGYVFDTKGYRKGDQVIVEGAFSKMEEYIVLKNGQPIIGKDGNPKVDTAIEKTIAVSRLIGGDRNRTPSEVAEENGWANAQPQNTQPVQQTTENNGYAPVQQPMDQQQVAYNAPQPSMQAPVQQPLSPVQERIKPFSEINISEDDEEIPFD